MTHFYLTLPSNAVYEIYPLNTVPSYYKCLRVLSWTVNGVALTEIMYNKVGEYHGEWLRYYEADRGHESVLTKPHIYSQSLIDKARTAQRGSDRCGHGIASEMQQDQVRADYIDVVNEGPPIEVLHESPTRRNSRSARIDVAYTINR